MGSTPKSPDELSKAAKGASSEADGFRLPEPSPELLEMFAKTDALLAGIPEEELDAAVKHFYFDAEGQPRIRTRQIRLVEEA